jgi:hypothetical protein
VATPGQRLLLGGPAQQRREIVVSQQADVGKVLLPTLTEGMVSSLLLRSNVETCAIVAPALSRAAPGGQLADLS